MIKFRYIFALLTLFFSKEDVNAQLVYSFKNDITQTDPAQVTDSTRRAKNRKFWAELWETYKEHYAPAVSVSGGLHTQMTSGTNIPTLGAGAGWSAVINFPFDRSHYINWEFTYHAMYGKDSSEKVIASDVFTYAGMRFYLTERNTFLRPYLSLGIAGFGYYIIPFDINAAAGLDYTVTQHWSVQVSASNVYSYRIQPSERGRVQYISYAGFLGLRYQL
ncbi:MAG TPA: hypothetical protein VEC36_03710 [Patescibacteria group bacterium]|nr:hypothetical protein [Patescibacteria group bacterium]